MENKELIVSFHPDKNKDELLEKIKKVAEQNNGKFEFIAEAEEKIEIKYSFENKEDREFASQVINLIIANYLSKEYSFETPESQIENRSFPEGIYHHFTFYDEDTARSCAGMLTAFLFTYCTPEEFDVSLVKLDAEDDELDEYLVIYGFPMNSIILMPQEVEDFFDSLDEAGEEDNFMSLPPTDKKLKGALN